MANKIIIRHVINAQTGARVLQIDVESPDGLSAQQHEAFHADVLQRLLAGSEAGDGIRAGELRVERMSDDAPPLILPELEPPIEVIHLKEES